MKHWKLYELMPHNGTVSVFLVIFFLLHCVHFTQSGTPPVTEDFTCKGNKNLIFFKLENWKYPGLISKM